MNQTIRSYNWTPKERIDHLMYLRSNQFITDQIRKINPKVAALPKSKTDLFDYRVPGRNTSTHKLVAFLKPGLYDNLEIKREIRFDITLDDSAIMMFSELLEFLGLTDEKDIKREDVTYYDNNFLGSHPALVRQCYTKTYNNSTKTLEMKHSGTLYSYSQTLRVAVLFNQDSYSIKWN